MALGVPQYPLKVNMKDFSSMVDPNFYVMGAHSALEPIGMPTLVAG